jgi:hypothetical protein
VDFEADGKVVNASSDRASKKLDLNTLEIKDFPGFLTKTSRGLF